MTIDQESIQLMEEVRLGIEAEAFLNSPVGRYMEHRADQEIAAALEELKKVDPADCKRIMALQNDIYRAESFKAWLAEAIQNGWQAETQLRATEGF